MDRISWDEFNPNESYLLGERWEPVAISCPKCGARMDGEKE